jgi:sarcosine oxidase subunit beta
MFVMTSERRSTSWTGSTPGDRAGGDRAARAGDVAGARRRLSGEGALYHPPGGIIRPRRGGLGVGERRGRRAAPRSTPYRKVTDRAPPTGAPLGGSRRRASDRGGHVVSTTAGWSSIGRAMAGVELPITHAHPPGLRDRAAEAAARLVVCLLPDARLHLADRPRRVPDRGRDRALDHLPQQGTADLPPGGARATRSSSSHSWSARAISGAGRGSGDITPDYSPILGRTEVEGFLVSAGGAPTASRPRRSSARPWPS